MGSWSRETKGERTALLATRWANCTTGIPAWSPGLLAYLSAVTWVMGQAVASAALAEPQTQPGGKPAGMALRWRSCSPHTWHGAGAEAGTGAPQAACWTWAVRVHHGRENAIVNNVFFNTTNIERSSSVGAFEIAVKTSSTYNTTANAFSHNVVYLWNATTRALRFARSLLSRPRVTIYRLRDARPRPLSHPSPLLHSSAPVVRPPPPPPRTLLPAQPRRPPAPLPVRHRCACHLRALQGAKARPVHRIGARDV